MAPNDQYLCIVPGRGRSTDPTRVESLVLPFEGDMTLSTILSKAFMLPDDDKITDPGILRQIKSVWRRPGGRRTGQVLPGTPREGKGDDP
jgi:hypothetical protein